MDQNKLRIVTVRAPVNIAVIKYWGKVDDDLIIPTNDSISGTLDVNDLHAMTSVAASPNYTEDQMWLNGRQESVTGNQRLVNCLAAVRRLSSAPWREWHIRIVSRNNFPTAAGLASSAAGYACLMYALGQLMGVTDRETISRLARIGSGSACRSVYGGFVQWHAGRDDLTSVARQIVPASHWPEMRILVLVVSDQRKSTSSTTGMRTTVETSTLFGTRVSSVVPGRVAAMRTAILERDFNTFARVTMQDSNQFHALAQDTWPPVRYMNDTSWAVVRFVHAVNEFWGSDGGYRAAYTFDAGPNCCIYTLESEVPRLIELVSRYFPGSAATDSGDRSTLPIRGIQLDSVSGNANIIPSDLLTALDKSCPILPNSLKYIINTRVGSGPEIIPPGSADLISPSGEPVLE